jgi:hypothetical protein
MSNFQFQFFTLKCTLFNTRSSLPYVKNCDMVDITPQKYQGVTSTYLHF